MKKRRELRGDELALWGLVVKSVAPLHGRVVRVDLAEPSVEPKPQPKIARAAQPAAMRAPPHPKPRTAAPADRSGEKRVRRGRIDAYASLDLHGLTQTQAQAALRRFLRRAVEEGAREVIVVTGKGMRQREHDRHDDEPRPGILWRNLPDWLAAPELSRIVSGYSLAHAKHGGAGAYYVFLRRP